MSYKLSPSCFKFAYFFSQQGKVTSHPKSNICKFRSKELIFGVFLKRTLVLHLFNSVSTVNSCIIYWILHLLLYLLILYLTKNKPYWSLAMHSETEKENKLSFLEIEFISENGKFITTVYQKLFLFTSCTFPVKSILNFIIDVQ